MMKVSGLIEWVEVGQGGSPPKEKKKHCSTRSWHEEEERNGAGKRR